LLKHRAAIEDAVFSQVSALFGLDTTVTLYDLTHILRLRSGQALFRRRCGHQPQGAAGAFQGAAQ
jgi:hypothetical protein